MKYCANLEDLGESTGSIFVQQGLDLAREAECRIIASPRTTRIESPRLLTLDSKRITYMPSMSQ
jgi:hypothetical protein